MRTNKSAAIFLALGLSLAGLSGAAQAAGYHGGGGGHFGGGAIGHAGGGHFGHGGGHFGHHYGGHGYGGFGYGLGFGLGLGALYYGAPYYDDDYGYDDGSMPDLVPGNVAPPQVPGYWYRCDSPAGFYPYVALCSHPWQAVPATPPPPAD